MPRLESSIERDTRLRVIAWAREQDIDLLYLKLSIIGMAGFPDRIILYQYGNVLFVELKQAGKKPGKLQQYIHSLLRGMGFTVQVHDNVNDAVEHITKEIQTTLGARERDQTYSGR